MPNGLVGKLTLDVSGVMKSIDELQKGLANLGKGGGAGNGNITLPGVDALKKQLEGVSTQLTKINEQLKNLGKGGGGSGGTAVDQHAQAIKQLIKLYTDYERIQQRLANSSVGAAERKELQAQAQAIQDKINYSKQYTDAQRQAAQASEKVQAAVNKTR